MRCTKNRMRNRVKVVLAKGCERHRRTKAGTGARNEGKAKDGGANKNF